MEASSQNQSRLGLFLLAGFSVALSHITFLFGGIPLRLLFIRAGSARYWLISSFLSISLLALGSTYAPLGMLFFSLVTLIGVYSEAEQRFKLDRFLASLISVIASSGLILGFLLVWREMSDQSLTELVKAQVAQVVAMVNNPEANKEELSSLLFKISPSLVINVLFSALALSFVYERVWLKGKKVLEFGKLENLLEFKVPDHLVWPSCGLALGAFTDLTAGLPIAQGFCLNGFIVFAGLYFFQGLAITIQIMRSLKFAGFIQALMLVLLIGQAYFLSFIGFIDLWFDFRGRLKKTAEEKKLKSK